MAFKMKGAPYKQGGNGKSMTKTVTSKKPQRGKDEKIDAYYARMKQLGHTVNEDGSVTFKK